MKGIVFAEFSEMVENRFSPELHDEIIVECDLASGRVYTSVGNYDLCCRHQIIRKRMLAKHMPLQK